MTKRLGLAAALLALLWAAPAGAQNCPAIPFTFTQNTTIKSAQVNANFTSLLTCQNNSLAHNGVNSDITQLTGLTTPLTVGQGGTGFAQTFTDGQLLIGDSTAGGLGRGAITAGSGISVVNGHGSIIISSLSGGGSVTSVGLADATNGGMTISGSSSPITGSGVFNVAVNVNDLASKATPVASDLIAIYDVVGGATKSATAAKVVAGVPCSSTLAGAVPATGGGTANFLRADCTFAAPGASGLIKLASQTASASATIPFTSGIDSSYNEYEIHFDTLLPDSANTTLELQVSADGGATWKTTGYNWNGLDTAGGSVSHDGATNASSINLSAGLSVDSTATRVSSGRIKFSRPAGTDFTNFIYDCAIYQKNIDTTLVTAVGRWATAGAINGVRILMSSGNLATGNFVLYGVAK